MGIASFMLSSSGHTQNWQPSLRNYTIDEGLPSNECYDVLQDKQGYIWISTDNGVSRFDGYKFENFGPKEGLTEETILFMQEDHRGWLWFCGFPSNLYLKKGQKIEPYLFNHIIEKYRDKFYSIQSFWVAKDGTVHVGLSGFGFLIIDSSGHYEIIDSRCTKSYYSYLPMSGKKVLSVTHYRNISELKDHSASLRSVGISTTDTFSIIPLDYEINNQHGAQPYQVWYVQKDLLLLQHYAALYLLDATTLDILDYIHYPDLINCATVTADGYVAFGHTSKGGVAVYPSIEHLFSGQPPLQFLKEYTITHLLVEANQGMWISTEEEGIFFSSNYQVNNLQFPADRAKQHVIFETLPNHQLAIAQSDGSILVYDPQQAHAQSTSTYTLNAIADLVYHNEQNQLISISKELQLINLAPLQFSTHIKNPVSSHIGGNTGLLDRYNNSRLFVGNITSTGLVVLERKRGQWQQSSTTRLGNSKRSTSLAQLDTNLLIVGTDKGLFSYTIEEKETQRFPCLKFLEEQTITQLAVIDNERILIGTKSMGLVAANLKSGELLPNLSFPRTQHIKDILIDDKGHFWLNTKAGITILLIEQDTIQQRIQLSKHTGLPSNEVRGLKQNEYGVIALFKNSVVHFDSIPKIYVSNSSPFLQAAYWKNNYLDSFALRNLSWQQNNLQLHFNDLDYRLAREVEYRYRLAEHEDWINTNSNKVNLFNISPANYTLEVQSQKIDGSWSSSLYVPIRIIPAIWQRTAFWIIIGLFTLTFLSFLIRDYIRRLQRDRQRLQLEEEVNALQQQAYRAQMNPHFIFNCLNAIQGLVLGDEEEQEKANLLLADFSMLIRRALDASRQEVISLEEELALVRNYLELEQMRFNNNFSYEIVIDIDDELEWIYIPPMIIQPFVENSVLHGMTGKRGDGSIRLTFTATEEFININIWDNGPGLSTTQNQDKKKQHDSLGMGFTERRIQMHNGSTAGLKLTEPTDGNGQILGTRIQFQLRKQGKSTTPLR